MGEKRSYKVSGKDLVEEIKRLVKEGNARKIRIIHEGKVLVDIPLSWGAGAAAVTVLVAPVLAALGAIAALVAEVTVEIEKIDDDEE